MGEWIQRASMPTPRHDLQAIVVGKEIYAISGAGDTTVNAVEIYDTEADRWREGPQIPTERGWFGAARVGEKIYAIGGKRLRSEAEKVESGDDYTFDIRDSVEVLDFETHIWAATESLSSPRAGLLAVACRGKVYALAGNSMNTVPNGGPLDRVEIYDPETGRWAPGVPLPVPVQGPGVATVDDKIYVFTGIGGRKGESEVQSCSHVFDPVAREWSELAAVPTPRCDPGALAVGRKIYTFGGWGGSATFHTVVEVYDIDSDTWSVAEPLPEKKAWMATAEVGGRIFVMGGARSKEEGGYRWIEDLHEYLV